MDHDAKTAIAELTKIVKDGFERMEKGFASLDDRMEKGFAAVAEDIADIREQMVTKDDLKPIDDRLASVESKITGTNRRLDAEAMQRGDLKLPKRVSDLEEKTFGASRHPAHIPLG